MRLQRVSVEIPHRDTISFDVHPRLTVLTGVPRMERPIIADLVLSTLCTDRAGIHAEVALDSGQQLALFRPDGSDHLAVDIGASADVSSTFRDTKGRISVIDNADDVVPLLWMPAEALQETDTPNAWLSNLARADQAALWQAGVRLTSAEEELRAISHATQADPDEAELVEAVEVGHSELDDARQRHRRMQRVTLLAGTTLAAGAIANYWFFERVDTTAALIVASAGLSGGCWVYEHRLKRAVRRQESALENAGSNSYPDFREGNADSLLADERARHRLLDAAQGYRDAMAEWTAIAGEVPVSWALSHRTEIEQTALVHEQIRQLGSFGQGENDTPLSSAVTSGLTARFAEIRNHTSAGERLPLVIEDPFDHTDPSSKAPILEFIGRLSQEQQIILVSDDAEIESWARLEMMTGDLGLVELASAPERILNS